MTRPFVTIAGYKKVRAAVLSSLLAWLVWAGTATGHELRPAIADILIEETTVDLEIDMVIEPMLGGLDLSAISDTNESQLADEHDALRALEPDALADRFREAWPEISKGFTVMAGGTPVAMTLESITPGPLGNPDLPRDSRLHLTADLPPDATPVTFGWRAEYGALVLRQVSDDPDTAYTAFLTPGQVSDPIPRTGNAVRSWGAEFLEYVRLGYLHIIPLGLDHILFVLGLFFFSTHFRPLLWQVTAFTLAHTTTLALATLDLVSIPSSIVEPLIAASIAFVAIENLFAHGVSRWRTTIVFGFGLLHGLGFASVLGEVGLSPGRLISDLLGFNIGVEIAQLTVIAAAYVTLAYPFAARPWYDRIIARPASVAIAIVGLWWFVTRVFG